MHTTTKITRAFVLSHWCFAGFAILLISLGLTTIVLVMLFSLLALQLLTFKNYKTISIVFFFILVSIIFLGFVYFINQAVVTIPDIAEKALLDVNRLAQTYEINMPFSDIESFKNTVIKLVKTELSSLADFAKIASKEFLYLIIGIFIAVGMFITPKMESETEENISSQNLYSTVSLSISARAENLFSCFKEVMGAQLIISLINTVFTGIFIYMAKIPYIELLITFTFLCGLLPIIGNIISNSLIFSVASTVSPSLAIYALTFLIVLHKLEYFLNSRIIGGAIKNPMWLTLFALIIGERLIGIQGLILAPVFLRYLKKETQSIVL
jgi:predicted PurR-regulated permease PerM